MTAAVITLSVAVLLLTVLVVGLLRSHAEILRALHELGAGLELDRTDTGEAGGPPQTVGGIAAPRAGRLGDTPQQLQGSTLDGADVEIDLTDGRDTLIAFLSSGCTTCQGFWKAFRGDVGDVPGGARLVVVTQGLEQESPGALRNRAPRTVPLVLSTPAWDAFDVPGSPYFAYVDGSGQVLGEGSAATWDSVAQLLEQARSDESGRASTGGPVRITQPSPARPSPARP